MAPTSCASLFFARNLIQSLTHFRIVFGLQFLKCDPVETIHPLVAIIPFGFRPPAGGLQTKSYCSSSKLLRVLRKRIWNGKGTSDVPVPDSNHFSRTEM